MSAAAEYYGCTNDVSIGQSGGGAAATAVSRKEECFYQRQLIQAGEAEVEETLSVLAPIMDNKEQLMTLCSFLLDAGADFQVCSEQLFIHKNTVKYRIKKISEALGYNVMRFSESYECYVACLTYRLISL